jgi:hypothetical protein
MNAEPSEFELITLRQLIERQLPLVCSGSIWEFKDGSPFAADYGTVNNLRKREWIRVGSENGADDKRGGTWWAWNRSPGRY